MDTLTAIGRWLAKQHVVTGAYTMRENCGAPMRFICLMRKTSRCIC